MGSWAFLTGKMTLGLSTIEGPGEENLLEKQNKSAEQSPYFLLPNELCLFSLVGSGIVPEGCHPAEPGQ